MVALIQFENVCTDLRAQAEALVLFANDMDGLLTCALRPSNVFGPGEKQLVPSVLDIAKSRWAKVFIFLFVYRLFIYGNNYMNLTKVMTVLQYL